jgi:hypothetical protein
MTWWQHLLLTWLHIGVGIGLLFIILVILDAVIRSKTNE